MAGGGQTGLTGFVGQQRLLVAAAFLLETDGLVVLAVGSAQATLALYPTDEAASSGLATVITNPSIVAMYGPIPSETADAFAVLKTVMMGAFLTAVLAFVVVRRHTRTEEDEGRLELLGSGVVGRWAPPLMADEGSVPLHNPGFILDDKILPVGASLFSRIIEKRLPLAA